MYVCMLVVMVIKLMEGKKDVERGVDIRQKDGDIGRAQVN
jgi:hypothetical protein